MTIGKVSALVVHTASAENKPVLDALEEQGFRCEEAVSTGEAITRLGEASFDAIIVYESAAANGLDDFVDSMRTKHPRLAIIVVQNEYDGRKECRLFDLGIDDIVTVDYSPLLLATRAAMRTKNRRRMTFP
jgi:DNA-binding response OmpR family regulator